MSGQQRWLMLEATCTTQSKIYAIKVVGWLRWDSNNRKDVQEHMPSFWSGLAFETVWHIMFGAGPIIGDIPECTIYTCDKGMTKLPSTLRNSRRMHVSLKPRGTRLCSKVNCHGWR